MRIMAHDCSGIGTSRPPRAMPALPSTWSGKSRARSNTWTWQRQRRT